MLTASGYLKAIKQENGCHSQLKKNLKNNKLRRH
jgi:hypothetical protein